MCCTVQALTNGEWRTNNMFMRKAVRAEQCTTAGVSEKLNLAAKVEDTPSLLNTCSRSLPLVCTLSVTHVTATKPCPPLHTLDMLPHLVHVPGNGISD